jgi:hypothetical protein
VARKRIIDTEEFYFKADLVSLLGERGLHLYIRLWGIAEDWGGYEPKYSDIAFKMGALRFEERETKKYINRLIERGKIIEYNKDGKLVHWIVNFLEHQPLDNPSPPKLPLPEWVGCEILEYKSGKKYAKYVIIQEKLPVAYRSPTSNGVTVTKRNSNVTVTVTNKTEPSAAEAALKKVYDTGFNIYQLIAKTKKELHWGPDQKFPDEVILKVCEQYFKDKGTIKKQFPWFIKVLSMESAAYQARKNIEENEKAKKEPVIIGDLLKEIFEKKAVV